jgi:hypothetical protein
MGDGHSHPDRSRGGSYAIQPATAAASRRGKGIVTRSEHSQPTPPRRAAALLAELDELACRELAELLRPYLTADPDHLLDAAEAAPPAKLHPDTLVRMAREGRVKGAEKVGREWRFPTGRLEISAPPCRLVSTESAPATRRAPRRERTSFAAIRERA